METIGVFDIVDLNLNMFDLFDLNRSSRKRATSCCFSNGDDDDDDDDVESRQTPHFFSFVKMMRD